MKEYLILFIKGLIIGIGKIIPGISGAIIAIKLNVYEKSLEIICNFFKDVRKNFKFILPLIIGILIGILLFSKAIVYLLNNHYLSIMLLFIGLILGTVKIEKKQINLTSVILLSTIIYLMTNKIVNIGVYNFYIIILMGIIDAFSMIAPGVSGTALLTGFGYYDMVMRGISNIDLKIIMPFGIGLIIGIYFISKLMNYLFKNYKQQTNSIINLLIIASVVTMFMQTLNNTYSISNIIISLVLLLIGYRITSKSVL